MSDRTLRFSRILIILVFASPLLALTSCGTPEVLGVGQRVTPEAAQSGTMVPREATQSGTLVPKEAVQAGEDLRSQR